MGPGELVQAIRLDGKHLSSLCSLVNPIIFPTQPTAQKYEPPTLELCHIRFPQAKWKYTDWLFILGAEVCWKSSLGKWWPPGPTCHAWVPAGQIWQTHANRNWRSRVVVIAFKVKQSHGWQGVDFSPGDSWLHKCGSLWLLLLPLKNSFLFFQLTVHKTAAREEFWEYCK